MTYQVLARKWRPRQFDQVVGQEHVLRALINALDHNRLHHAFLFTGTRGVGKTTLARIFAKSLNCETGVSSTPCGKCAACVEIDEGRFVDLIEVDAASRTKVEDTRELLDNVQYAPTRGRYKVYLIDEVHMLSNHSFNALLKTLEEPPPHVKFLLATTDPQKLPVTILSRCLQFNLKRLPEGRIADHLQTILAAESVEFEQNAIYAIARAADGSMRDALSLMDQAIAHGDGSLKDSEVHAMLGALDRGVVLQLLNDLARADGAAVMHTLAQLDEQAPDYELVLSELLQLLNRVAVMQVVPQAAGEQDTPEAQSLKQLADSLLPEDVQLFYQIGVMGRRDLPYAPDPRSGLEMILLRMLAFRPVQGGARAQLPEQSVQTDSPTASQVKQRSSASAPVRTEAASTGSQPTEDPVPPTATVSATDGDKLDAQGWSNVIDALGIKAAARELAIHCAYAGQEDDQFKLVLDTPYAQINSDNARKRLQTALSQYFNRDLRLLIEVGTPATETPAAMRQRQQDERQRAALNAIEQDPVVQDLQETFGATVQAEWVNPSDS